MMFHLLQLRDPPEVIFSLFEFLKYIIICFLIQFYIFICVCVKKMSSNRKEKLQTSKEMGKILWYSDLIA